ncbi:unnamed protein product [Heligmosomoides polygyrus]|uniref:KTSC domain-containing protein n=1 Tax=Heligmosomoides polygyrus TaxID=6339 RepID=A0A183GWC5_HELPZ|nr:unnamed protein product [Heligmosomoides polygyrus]
MATTVNVTGASTTASTIRHIPSESKIVYVEYYDDSIYSGMWSDAVVRFSSMKEDPAFSVYEYMIEKDLRISCN